MRISQIVLILMALVLTGCKNKDAEDTEPPATQKAETLLSIIDSENGQPLDEIEFGKPVRLVLEAKNLTDQPIVFLFATRQQYDFEVRDENERRVWNWAHDEVFTQAQTTLTLGGDEQIKFT